MGYQTWFKEHGNKHKLIVDKLSEQGLQKDEIIEYFDFENMVDKEPDFCPLYSKNKKCHDINKLNCYLCACPYFRFNEAGFEKKNNKTVFSNCSINSKKGRLGEYGDKIHQDCSKCTVPHKEKFVAKNYDLDWFVPMTSCDQTKTT